MGGCLSQLLGERRLHLVCTTREKNNDCSGNKGHHCPAALTLILSSAFAGMKLE